MLKHHYQASCLLYVLLAFSLLCLLAACGGQSSGSNNSGNQNNASTPKTGATTPTTPTNGTQPTAQGGTPATQSSTPVPQTNTSCPAEFSARAAVMTPFSPGHDQNLVYIYNQPASGGSSAVSHLRRYDVATNQKTDIYSTAAAQIQQAQVSADGQWVMFLAAAPSSSTSVTAMIQIVRVDGKELQTLYCFYK